MNTGPVPLHAAANTLRRRRTLRPSRRHRLDRADAIENDPIPGGSKNRFGNYAVVDPTTATSTASTPPTTISQESTKANTVTAAAAPTDAAVGPQLDNNVVLPSAIIRLGLTNNDTVPETTNQAEGSGTDPSGSPTTGDTDQGQGDTGQTGQALLIGSGVGISGGNDSDTELDGDLILSSASLPPLSSPSSTTASFVTLQRPDSKQTMLLPTSTPAHTSSSLSAQHTSFASLLNKSPQTVVLLTLSCVALFVLTCIILIWMARKWCIKRDRSKRASANRGDWAIHPFHRRHGSKSDGYPMPRSQTASFDSYCTKPIPTRRVPDSFGIGIDLTPPPMMGTASHTSHFASPTRNVKDVIVRSSAPRCSPPSSALVSSGIGGDPVLVTPLPSLDQVQIPTIPVKSSPTQKNTSQIESRQMGVSGGLDDQVQVQGDQGNRTTLGSQSLDDLVTMLGVAVGTPTTSNDTTQPVPQASWKAGPHPSWLKSDELTKNTIGTSNTTTTTTMASCHSQLRRSHTHHRRRSCPHHHHRDHHHHHDRHHSEHDPQPPTPPLPQSQTVRHSRSRSRSRSQSQSHSDCCCHHERNSDNANEPQQRNADKGLDEDTSSLTSPCLPSRSSSSSSSSSSSLKSSGQLDDNLTTYKPKHRRRRSKHRSVVSGRSPPCYSAETVDP